MMVTFWRHSPYSGKLVFCMLTQYGAHKSLSGVLFDLIHMLDIKVIIIIPKKVSEWQFFICYHQSYIVTFQYWLRPRYFYRIIEYT